MSEPFVSRGFRGRRPSGAAGRLPPGQYETRDFPLRGPGAAAARWTWEEFRALPREAVTVDIHCVTKWSKFGTTWEGVSVDTLLAAATSQGLGSGPFVLAFCDGGYTT